MALADRDYYRTDPISYDAPPRRRSTRLSVGSVTMWLIVINVAVYLLDLILWKAGLGYSVIISAGNPFVRPTIISFPPLRWWGHFSALMAIQKLQIWRFVTFQFLHQDANHLIFNMIALFFFGPLVENYLGPRRFLPFYLLSGIGGAVLYLILFMTGTIISDASTSLVGASAGIFAVLIAAAQIAPNARVLVYFLFPIELRTLALLFIGFAVFTILFHGQNAGGEAAHLGGAAIGYLLLRFPNVLDRIVWLGKRPPPF